MTSANRHIVIISSNLDMVGGYEKIVPQAANLFAKKGNKVTLMLLAETTESFHPIDPGIIIIRHSMNFGITPEGNPVTRKTKMVSDIYSLRKILKKLSPDIIIATEYQFTIAAILSGAKSYARVISWEHTPVDMAQKSSFWNKLLKYTYPKLDSIVCQNETEKQAFEILNPNTAVIPNFTELSQSAATLHNKLILTVARLTAVKGIDLLLQTALIVLKHHPDWQWKIIGEGDMKADISAFIQQHQLEKQLLLAPPISTDLNPEYSECSLYVCTSRFESFGLTIAEAMACGLPCISFDCDTGPRHIINHNEDGILVEKENHAKLAEAIMKLMTDEPLRKKMGEKAFENVQRFSTEATYKLWEKLITHNS